MAQFHCHWQTISERRPYKSSRNLENETNYFPDLDNHSGADIAPRGFNTTDSNRADVLTLSGRCPLKTIVSISLDLNFRGKPT